jgi:hypothetical protein
LEIIVPCVQDITVMGAYEVRGIVVEDCPIGQEEDDHLIEMTGISSQREVSAADMRDMASALEFAEEMLDLE